MYEDLKIGVPTVVEEDETHQLVVTRSPAGHTETTVWKQGFEPVEQLTDVELLHAKIDALTSKLVEKSVLTPADVATIAVIGDEVSL